MRNVAWNQLIQHNNWLIILIYKIFHSSALYLSFLRVFVTVKRNSLSCPGNIIRAQLGMGKAQLGIWFWSRMSPGKISTAYLHTYVLFNPSIYPELFTNYKISLDLFHPYMKATTKWGRAHFFLKVAILGYFSGQKYVESTTQDSFLLKRSLTKKSIYHFCTITESP